MKTITVNTQVLDAEHAEDIIRRAAYEAYPTIDSTQYEVVDMNLESVHTIGGKITHFDLYATIEVYI